MAVLNKPTEFPRWGTDQSNEVDPSSGQKDTGWTNEQIPPSSFQNFLSRTTYDWINWLAERLDDDIDGGGVTENGVVLTDPLTSEPNGPSRGVTKVRLLNPVGGSVRIAAATITNNIGGGSTIQATGALFVTNGVILNDLIELVGTNSNDGFYLVSAITDEDNIVARRLDGAGFTFAAESGIQGTVKVYAKEAIRGELIAPGGWRISDRVSGESVTMRKNPGVGSSYDWTFPDALPSTKSVLTIDANGQVTAGDPSVIITIGDGTTSFGDFEGADETPFNDALAALPASGGLIRIGDGTYTFTTTLDITDNNAQLIGLDRDNVLIIGSLASAAVVLISGERVLFKGIHVRQTQGDSENFVIQVTGDDARVIECRTEHTFVAATPSFGFKVVQILNADNTLFERNEVLFAEVDSDVDRIGVHVFCESTGADEEMFHARILQNDFIITNDGSASLDQNSVIRIHAKASATGHAKLYKWIVEGNIERAPIGVENTLQSIALYAENDAGGAAGDIARVRGGIVRGNITGRGISLIHDRQNGASEDPEVEDNTIQGNMITTSAAGDPVVEFALNSATIPVDTRNSGLLAGRFVAPTSGVGATIKVDDSDFNQKGNLQSS